MISPKETNVQQKRIAKLLRIPPWLFLAIEEAAYANNESVNAWIERQLSAAVKRAQRQKEKTCS